MSGIPAEAVIDRLARKLAQAEVDIAVLQLQLEAAMSHGVELTAEHVAAGVKSATATGEATHKR